MTATVDAVLSTVQGDGGGNGLTITTPATMTGKRVLAFVGSSTNADTITAPGTGTWAEVTLTDNVITTSGGQLRCFEGRSLSGSTAYTFSLSGGRRTIGAVVISGHDDSGATMVDVKGSLESAAGSTHAPPSVTPTASSELVVDCMMFRQFAPDTSTGSPPSTGLTWTEDLDTRGADTNNNIQMNIGHATAGSSGVAISTAPWNTNDPNEPTLVARVVIKSAAGGTTHSADASLTATGTRTATAAVDRPATSTLTGTATVTPAAAVDRPAAATRTATGMIAAAAAVDRPAAAALTVTATLTATAAATTAAATALSALAAITATATVTTPGVEPVKATSTDTVTDHYSSTPAVVARRTSTDTVTSSAPSTPAVAALNTSTDAVTARATSSGGVT